MKTKFQSVKGSKSRVKDHAAYRSEVERIPSMPDLAEDPKVEQVTLRTAAIKVGVLAPPGTTWDTAAELELREVAELVRDDLLALPAVSVIVTIVLLNELLMWTMPLETLRRSRLRALRGAGVSDCVDASDMATSSPRPSCWPPSSWGPCGCGRWCGCADRGPGVPCGGGCPGSS